jgi:uncharacterized iron-regulated membrane protein
MNQLSDTSLSWPTRLGLAFLFIVVALATLALSAFLFAFLLVLAIPAGLWLWWQSRRLRRWAETEHEVLEDRPSQRETSSGAEQPKD